MRAAGVDLIDEDAMDAWVEAFNRRPPADRRDVLGELLDSQPELAHARFIAREGVVAAVDPRAPVPSKVRPDPADEQAGAYPPVTLAEDYELAAAARASTLLGRVITLARWVGSGRPVSRRGELIPPDARDLAGVLGLSEAPDGAKVTDMRDVPPLTMAFYLAVETELIAVRRTGILPGRRIGECDRLDHGPGADEVALALWEELFDLTARQAATPPADPQPPLNALNEWAAWWGPRTLTMLYERQAAVDLAELVASLVSEHQATADHEESTEGTLVVAALLGLTVRATLAELADHGAVTITTPIPPDTHHATPAGPAPAAIGLPARALDNAAGVTAQLTPLGIWAVRRALLAEGAQAPAITAHA